MSDPLETELKLDMESADRERLDAVEPFASIAEQTDRLVSTYFDTPDLDLRYAGFSLRVRREGRKRIQTVKADDAAAAGLFVRPEWERAIRGDTPVLDEASGPLVQVIGAPALARIGPVFVTDIRRTVRMIGTADVMIEAVADHGSIQAGDRREAVCEIELELRDGAPQALFDLARLLNEEVPLRLGVRSKAERGYGLIDGGLDRCVKAEPITLDPAWGAGEAFAAIARSCVRQFRLNETMLLETGQAEALHQARVGLRRLRSAFSLFRHLLDGDAFAELLGAELRWLAGELGEVRNLDVLIERVDDDDGVREQLIRARELTFDHVRTELASARARLLMIDLAEWLALGAWRMRPVDSGLLHRGVELVAGDLLDAHRKRLKHRGRRIATLDDAHRHKVRIEAKKLRYATDFFASLYQSKKGRRRHKLFRAALEELQDHLGALNDLAVGPEILAGLGIAATLPDAGRRDRKRLLSRAEKAFESLVDAKRFWR